MIRSVISICMSMFLAVGSTQASDVSEIIENSMVAVERECSGYARVLTNAKWTVVTRKAQEQGKTIPDSYRDSLYKIHLHQCITIQKIQIMEMLEEMTPENDWSKMGGNTILEKLNDELLKTI